MFYDNQITSRFPLAVKACMIILFLSKICSAQQGQYQFNLVTAPDSIELQKVTGITQDSKGYMWFVDQRKQCLIRYDGYNMKRYVYNPGDSNSLGGNGLHRVYADKEGKIWLGIGNGLDQFDTKTGRFKHYKHDQNDPNSFNGDFVNPILRDRKGYVWIGTGKGLERLDVNTGKFKHYHHDPNNPKSLSCDVVWTIYEDHRGELWIGTGFPWSPEPDGGLNRMDKKTGTFTNYLHDPNDPHSLVDNKVGAIFEDSKGTFWVGTRGDGLHTMDRENGSFERHPYNPAYPWQLSRPPLKHKSDMISFIQEDGAGVIWIGTNWSGMNAYDPASKKISHFEDDHVFPDKAVWAAFTSQDGELWVATEINNHEPFHLYRMDPFLKNMSHIRTPNPVSVFHEDKNGNIWLGTVESGLALLPRNNADSIKTFHLPKDLSHFDLHK